MISRIISFAKTAGQQKTGMNVGMAIGSLAMSGLFYLNAHFNSSNSNPFESPSTQILNNAERTSSSVSINGVNISKEGGASLARLSPGSSITVIVPSDSKGRAVVVFEEGVKLKTDDRPMKIDGLAQEDSGPKNPALDLIPQ